MVLEIRFEWQNGFLHVTSEEVPGLHLCGSNPQEVLDDVIPAIKALFKLNRGWNVEVVPETDTSRFPSPVEKLDLFIARTVEGLVAYQQAA
jgi:hypothetical protein